MHAAMPVSGRTSRHPPMLLLLRAIRISEAAAVRVSTASTAAAVTIPGWRRRRAVAAATAAVATAAAAAAVAVRRRSAIPSAAAAAIAIIAATVAVWRGPAVTCDAHGMGCVLSQGAGHKEQGPCTRRCAPPRSPP